MVPAAVQPRVKLDRNSLEANQISLDADSRLRIRSNTRPVPPSASTTFSPDSENNSKFAFNNYYNLFIDRCLSQAEFPILPSADVDLLEEAHEAVRREYRDSSKCKRLRCQSVRRADDSDNGTVFVLQVGARRRVRLDMGRNGGVSTAECQRV